MPLRHLVLATHMQDLKEVTHAKHYENFRRQKLNTVLVQRVRWGRLMIVVMTSFYRMMNVMFLFLIITIKAMRKSLKACILNGKGHSGNLQMKDLNSYKDTPGIKITSRS